MPRFWSRYVPPSCHSRATTGRVKREALALRYRDVSTTLRTPPLPAPPRLKANRRRAVEQPSVDRRRQSQCVAHRPLGMSAKGWHTRLPVQRPRTTSIRVGASIGFIRSQVRCALPRGLPNDGCVGIRPAAPVRPEQDRRCPLRSVNRQPAGLPSSGRCDRLAAIRPRALTVPGLPVQASGPRWTPTRSSGSMGAGTVQICRLAATPTPPWTRAQASGRNPKKTAPNSVANSVASSLEEIGRAHV